jgi:hypothetical protein
MLAATDKQIMKSTRLASGDRSLVVSDIFIELLFFSYVPFWEILIHRIPANTGRRKTAVLWYARRSAAS